MPVGFWTDEWFEVLDELRQFGHDEIPEMIDALGHRNAAVRRAMEIALMNIGQHGGYDLVGAFKDKSLPVTVRYRICNILSWIIDQEGAPIYDMVTALAESLGDTDPAIRRCCAIALGIGGPAAESAVDDLIAALRDEEAYVRAEAATALGEIGAPALRAIPALEKLQVDAIEDVRTAAEEALARLR